jgi:D-glycero-beta-D-manno-heptose 1-phosphate adenylyltransferase
MSRVPNNSRFYTLDNIKAFVQAERVLGRTIAFTNGCFDILHAGHIHALQEAAQLADVLIVGLNSDASTKRLKGPDRPFNNELDRATVLNALRCVNAVALFEEDTPLTLIKAILPDVLVKGGDYAKDQIVGASVVEEAGGKVVIIDLIAGLSTTSLSQKIKLL